MNKRISVDTLASEDDNKVISNFQISQQLIKEKTSLIDALSQFPVTARWLLFEYEQQYANKAYEEDEEVALLSESAAALTDVKKRYEMASQLITCSDACQTEAKQHLTEALKRYPYSFYDLSRLVDIIVYVFKLRNLCCKSPSSGSNKDSEIIKKRLDGIEFRIQSDNSQFLSLIKASLGNLEEERFLYLGGSDIKQIFPVIVMSEYRWLRSREQLTVANTRLVMFIANQYKGGFLEFDDLVQEGQTGLLKAVDRYNYQLGYKFSTYAGYWIRQAISRALSRCERVVRIPCGQIGIINKVFRIREQLIAKFGKEPSVQELSEYASLTHDEINSILTIAQSSVAIEDSSEDDDTVFSPIDFLEQQTFTHPFRDIAQSDLEKLITKAIKLLNPREARVICGHFGVQYDQEMTLKEIGNEMNLTRERIRQIQVSALNKMKQYYGAQLATCL